ncbi:MAG: RidA family protein [Pseudomonadota bacterium]|jgi:enamine deaminase RidA (YjgF/YER057c/UK114 family)|nr:RidA family protein [Pseudomonadota bacterium]MEE3282521.1 RidA family protein [Pseudomonadota bacterium]|tara:strand:- start:12 stop:473 length:462 start_codon:yes stop_codon:yes gene_type:complete
MSNRLQTLGIELPAPREPAFSYSAVVIDNGLAWVSGQLPWLDGSNSLVYSGRLGEHVNVTEGKSCARACILNGLAVLEKTSGSLDRIERVIKLVGYVASAKDFHEQPAVIDAASNLLVEIFGDAGTHARSAVGVAQLPRGAPVEIELVVRLRS